MGVGEDFRSFCDRLRIPNRQSISQRYRRITKRLNLDFWGMGSETAHSFYVGSYGRGTAICGFSDLDMTSVMPDYLHSRYHRYQTNGQSALLQAVRNSLQSTYPSTAVGGDGQVVVICFTDGLCFEIVSAHARADGAYTYPDSNSGGRWRVTNRKPEISAVAAVDAACNGSLTRLCRMARAWKIKWNVPMGGLLIDTLACRFLRGWAYRTNSYVYYDWMTRDFFDYLANQPDVAYWLAVGSGQYIYTRGLFQYKARQCCNIARNAIAYAADGREWSSRQEWRRIYGTAYPS